MNIKPAHRSAPSFASSGFQFGSTATSLLRRRWLLCPGSRHLSIHPVEFILQVYELSQLRRRRQDLLVCANEARPSAGSDRIGSCARVAPTSRYILLSSFFRSTSSRSSAAVGRACWFALTRLVRAPGPTFGARSVLLGVVAAS